MTTSDTSSSVRLLLAEDDEIMRITLNDYLSKQGWSVDEAEDGNKALQLLQDNTYHMVISDIRMPGLDGQQLLEKVKEISPEANVILMTAYGGTEHAVSCLKKGASDYILKPFDMDDLIIRIKRLLEIQAIKRKCVSLEEGQCKRSPIVGSSEAIMATLQLVSQVALSDATVLVHGESGSGKELVAAAIHYGSKRAACPYIRINCAAIPAGLMESEFFGHEKGAFTGADCRKLGKFELADQGTILLDEIGDMPIDLQAKLLRVLQENEIERVGGTKSIPINVRVICVTAKDLKDQVRQGAFREDLFYRLQVIPIEVPPLRQRKEDIAPLSTFFLREFSLDRGIDFALSDEALTTLESYNFPGNVRELKNIIERICVLATSPLIQFWNLPPDIIGSTQQKSEETITLSAAVAEAEKTCIIRALRQADGTKSEAAKLLGISRKNLWEKLKRYDL